MGVSVSHPLRQRTTKAKYILTLDGGSSEFDGTEQFFSHQEHNKGETSRVGKGCSEQNEASCLQFKGGRANSGCPFDSLDTIDSRKSVPFAVLPQNNTQPSSRPPNGELAFASVHSDGETISVDRSGKVLLRDDAEHDFEDESSARKERNTSKPADYVQQKVIDPSRVKLKKNVRASSSTRFGEKAHSVTDKIHGNSLHSGHCAENGSDMCVTHEGFVDASASEQEVTRMIRADSEPDMVCL